MGRGGPGEVWFGRRGREEGDQGSHERGAHCLIKISGLNVPFLLPSFLPSSGGTTHPEPTIRSLAWAVKRAERDFGRVEKGGGEADVHTCVH